MEAELRQRGAQSKRQYLFGRVDAECRAGRRREEGGKKKKKIGK